jgi:Zn-dependent protease
MDLVMAQEYYGPPQKQDQYCTSDERERMLGDYVYPECSQAAGAVVSESSGSEEVPVSPHSYDYMHPSYYSVFPSSPHERKGVYTPTAIDWKEGDEERGRTQDWRQEKIKDKSIGKKIIGVGGLLAVIGSWLLKLKGLAFLLKFGMAGFSALISVVLYSISYGWQFALLLVGLLFIHEMGHVLAIRAKGMPVRGMLFIPFFGAAVSWSGAKNVKDEAEVALAGPFVGGIGSAFCLLLVLAFHWESTVWLPLAYLGFWLNLANLAPIWPLDGGRVFDAINRWVWVGGLVVLLGLQVWFWLQGNPSLWLLLLLVMAALRLFGIKSDQIKATYYEVSLSTRLKIAAMYFGLVILLVFAVMFTHSLLRV